MTSIRVTAEGHLRIARLCHAAAPHRGALRSAGLRRAADGRVREAEITARNLASRKPRPADAQCAWHRIIAPLVAWFLFSGVISSWGGDPASVLTDLPTWLKQFDATVVSPEERQAAARMIEEDVQHRLRESNERSSAEWKSITSRAEWEQFRSAKLAALRNS